MNFHDTPAEPQPLSPSQFRCASYATAQNYDLRALFRDFQKEKKTTWFRDVLYVHMNPEEERARGFFCFSYGVVVAWGISEEEDERILEKIKLFEIDPFDSVEKEVMPFSFGEKTSIVDDQIILSSPLISLRLAISHAIAQSAKLARLESIVKKTIDNTRYIPEHLSKTGMVPLTKREIGKKMGELFIERSSINLHLDILDVPEYFWDYPELEPVYRMMAVHLELSGRLDVLNKRLDIIHDLLEMLGTEMNHQHSSRLEWIIILLIVLEVIISLAPRLHG